MANVAKHGPTHRLRFLGGTDPLDVELPFLLAVESGSYGVSADGELEWTSPPTTNDGHTFVYDDTDPAGLLIQRDGIYAFFMQSYVAPGNEAIDRGIRMRIGNVSGGSTGDFEGDAFFDAGLKVVDSGSAQLITADPKLMLWQTVVEGLVFVDPEDPRRIALFFNHMGSNFSAVNTTVSIYRIASLDGTSAPMKWEETP